MANLFGISVNLLNQVVLVPLYLTYWSVDRYGDWIVLNALASLTILIALGINAAVQNTFTQAYAQGNRHDCNSLLTANGFFILLFFILIAGGLLLLSSYIPLSRWLSLGCIPDGESRRVLFWLVTQSFIGMLMDVPDSIFRAVHRYHEVTVMDHLSRLVTVGIIAVSLISDLSMPLMAALMGIPYLINAIVKTLRSTAIVRFRPTAAGLHLATMRTILINGAGQMTFPMCYSAVLHGTTMIVNAYFGASLVVVFTVTRTMCNFVKIFVNLVLNSVWPEFAIAYSRRDVAQMRTLYRQATLTAFSVALILSLLLLTLGPTIYRIWTASAVTFSYPLMAAFLVTLLVNSLWFSGSVTLLATNLHLRFSLLNLLLTALYLLTAYLLSTHLPTFLTTHLPSLLATTLPGVSFSLPMSSSILSGASSSLITLSAIVLSTLIIDLPLLLYVRTSTTRLLNHI